ncbi:HlyD family secretion protein [Natronospira proteinivora]|uniref:HlyD family secretion protein n=1 Tax=Natronospira proteinivora TaxID=1807133 RepID=A0ABT1G6K5_9GAMM|nr:efflux RND transporter periplasmic adaptor subunit [Natronospira proteinivora]MCP1726886.1 HlyD family secretion protein [Natronospira proteinivora]
MNIKKLLIFVAVLLGAALIWWLGQGERSGPGGGGWPGDGDRDQAVAVEVGQVSHQTIQDIAEYTGTLQAAHRFNLAPKVGGRLRSLEVDIGDRVSQGQVIARLDDEEFEQEVAEARAALQVAEAQLEDARANKVVREREYGRLADLREQGLASESEYDVGQSEYDAARANVRVNEAQVAQREAALGAARLRLSHATVRAEWNGGDENTERLVGERFVDEGSMVPANEPLITVLDTGSLRAVTFVTDRDFARMSRGQTVEIRSDAWPGEHFEGSVARIAPQLQEATRQARVEIDVPNEERRLSPGFFVKMRIQVEEVADARVVPNNAVTRYAGERGIFRVEAPDEDAGEERPKARFVPITLGIQTEQYSQILEPDIEGRVVTLGQHRLGDGTPLRISESD